MQIQTIQKLHAHLIVTGFYRHPSSISKVLSAYAFSPPNLKYAHLVFEQIEQPSIFIWNTIIRGFAQSDRPENAIFLFGQMRCRGYPQDNFTFPFVLKACGRVQAIGEGKKIHMQSLKLGLGSDVFISNSLIHMYASCGDLDGARQVFNEVPVRDLVSWNSLICGYSQNNRLREVLDLFEVMQGQDVEADKVTMVKVVSACTRLGNWELAISMVKYIEERHLEVDLYLGNTLIDFYGRCRLVEQAERVYKEMKERNIVTWNAMITSYAKAGDLASARKLFDGMPERDLISWTSMIAGYSQASNFSDALMLFRQMQRENVKPDEIVVVSVLSACAHLAALDLGKWIHNYIRKSKIKEDVYVGNSLIDMYSKCGCIEKALEVFREMMEKDTLSWNSIILGLATNGYAPKALEYFSRMLREGFWPNDVTFLGILIACSHGGFVDRGLEYFTSMREVYQVEPQMKHYGCLVDLLSRSGELHKAHEFIMNMPLHPDPVIWRTLLSACKVHGNVGLAEIVTNKLLQLDPSNSGNYILLSNTYSCADRWNDSMKVRETMAVIDVQKAPGCSSIEINGTVHEFMLADKHCLPKTTQAAVS